MKDVDEFGVVCVVGIVDELILEGIFSDQLF